MAKRANRGVQGNGSIRQRSNGTWEGRYTAGRDPKTGKQVQRSVYGKTQKEVAQKLRQINTEMDEGTYTEPCRLTVGEWLDIWTEKYIGNVKERTQELYRNNVEVRIKPALGSIKLSKLTTDQIQSFYNGLMKGERAITPKTVKNIHGVLHRALVQAVKLGYIRLNPADNVTLPKQTKPELTPLTDEHLTDFINAIKGHPYENFFLVDLFTGMRRSELIGLTWGDIDFDRGTITISRQLIPARKNIESKFTPTKNGKVRVIAPAQSVMDILRRQKEQQERMAEIAQEAWSNPEGFVFTNEFGRHLAHNTVYHHFKRIVEKIGMPNVRLHDLRHSYAIASLYAGDDIKTLQENLGHHTAAFTLNVYGHVSMQMKRESSKRMDAFIQNISNSSDSDQIGDEA